MQTIDPATLTPIKPPCPECRTGRVSLITDGLIGKQYVEPLAIRGAALPVRFERRPFFACNECEFCIEIDPRDLRATEARTA